MSLGDRGQSLVSRFPCAQREPRNKRNPLLLTKINERIPFAIGEAIAILHRCDWNDLECALEMFPCHIRQADHLDLSLCLQFGERFNRRIERRDRIGRMQLIQLDALESQPLQAAFNRLAQVIGARIMGPLIWSGTVPPALGRDNEIFGIRRKGFSDQFFTDVGPVGVSRVDEIYAQFHRVPEHGEGAGAILRRAPDSVSRYAHGAKTQAMDVAFPEKRNIRSNICRKILHRCVHEASLTNSGYEIENSLMHPNETAEAQLFRI